MRTLPRWIGAGLRGLGQAWAILGLTLLLLLLVDHLLRAFLPDPLAATPFEAGAVAPARERAAAVAGDDWIGRYWREHAGARDTEWRSYVYWRRKAHQGEIINVDAHGFRVTPRPAEPAAREIWVFGGSVVWGTGNRDAGTLAAQLQQVYAERAPELRVRVLNFGESGYVSRQSLAAFQSALACPEPAADLAVFLDGANDVFATLQARQAGLPQNEDNRRREFNTSRRFAAQLRASAMQLEGIGRLAAAPPAPFDDATMAGLAADTADAWLSTVRQAQAIGAAFDVAVLPLWQPTAFDRNPAREDEAGIVGASPANHVRLQRATRAAVLAQLESAPLAQDLGGIFDTATEPRFFDFVHLSEAAQRQLAERIFELSLDSLRARPAQPRTLAACSDRPLG